MDFAETDNIASLKPKSKTKMTVALIVLHACLLALVACSPENPRLTAPAPVYGIQPEAATLPVEIHSPKLDILFVIDNSESMADEQIALSKNIDKFTGALANQSGIDFHIGAVSIWDSITYKDMKKDYKNGQLRRLKYPDGTLMPEGTQPFVSSSTDYDSALENKGFRTAKEPGWLQVLRSSLKIGYETYNKNWQTEHTGGPNIEEVFTPVAAALSDEMAANENKGFRRQDAHLVIIFITDSEASVHNADGTTFDLSPGELETMIAQKVGSSAFDKVTALGVLSRSTDDPMERDPSIRFAKNGPTEPVQIQKFISRFNGKWMGLRDKDYGVKLANLGRYVRERTLTRPRIELSRKSEWDTITVRIEGEADPLPNDETGWVYDESGNSIVIMKDLASLGRAARFEVKYTKVLPTGYKPL